MYFLVFTADFETVEEQLQQKLFLLKLGNGYVSWEHLFFCDCNHINYLDQINISLFLTPKISIVYSILLVECKPNKNVSKLTSDMLFLRAPLAQKASRQGNAMCYQKRLV
jgi:hypothetical protein